MMIKCALLTLSLAASLTLPACAFQPLHSTSASSPLQAMNVSFESTRALGETGDRAEFLLRQALNDRMATGRSNYNLVLRPQIRRSSIGVTADDIASRYDLTLNIIYVLSDAATGEILVRDNISSVSTYGAPRDPYGRIAAQTNAEERLAVEAADRLILKLGVYFKTGNAVIESGTEALDDYDGEDLLR